MTSRTLSRWRIAIALIGMILMSCSKIHERLFQGPSFNFPKLFNAPLYTVATATDGSGDVYAGGGFSTYLETESNRIIRLNPDGTIDAGFDVGTGFNGIVWSINPTSDGSGDVYVGDIVPRAAVTGESVDRAGE